MEEYQALVMEWRTLAKDMYDLAKEFGKEDAIQYEKFLLRALMYLSKIQDSQKSLKDAYDVVEICSMINEFYQYSNSYDKVVEYAKTQYMYGEAIYAQTKDTSILLKVGSAYKSICTCLQQQDNKVEVLACMKNGIQAIEPGCNQFPELNKMYLDWQQQISILEQEHPTTPVVPAPVPVSETKKPMYCIMCGSKNSSGARFCIYCGKKLKE